MDVGEVVFQVALAVDGRIAAVLSLGKLSDGRKFSFECEVILVNSLETGGAGLLI